MKTVVIGLGNPSRRDHAVGLEVVRLLRDHLPDASGVSIKELWYGGLALAQAMAGFDRVILVDATRTLDGRAGTISRLSLAQLSWTRTIAAPGEIALPEAMESWRQAGWPMPDSVEIWGIEARDVDTHGQDLTAPLVRASVSAALQIYADLRTASEDRVRKAA